MLNDNQSINHFYVDFSIYFCWVFATVFSIEMTKRLIGNLITAIFFRLIKDVDLTVCKFTGYGKNFPKSVKLSPDSYIQTAFQLAYYR